MKSILILGIAVLFFSPFDALGVVPGLKTNLTVKFDQYFYDLEFGPALFKYSESTRVYSIKIKDCNRRELSQIESTYQTLLIEHSHQTPRQKTKYDVELSTGGKKIEVARGSSLGTWLREMPKKIMYIDAEARVLCKR